MQEQNTTDFDRTMDYFTLKGSTTRVVLKTKNKVSANFVYSKQYMLYTIKM
jgi:hypothetical protein